MSQEQWQWPAWQTSANWCPMVPTEPPPRCCSRASLATSSCHLGSSRSQLGVRLSWGRARSWRSDRLSHSRLRSLDNSPLLYWSSYLQVRILLILNKSSECNERNISGQRIVQQVSLNPGNINCNIVNKSGIVTPSASGPTATQIVGSGGGVSPAPNSIPQTATSPQSSSMAPAPTGPPESQMLVQLSNHQSDGVSPHFLLANTNQKSGLVSQQMMTGSLNQSTLNNKLRQQRKQSLKWH